MTIPVYVFTGFLESGKTTLIKETLLEAGFKGEEKTLLLVCEEGIEEYDDAFLKKAKTAVVTITKQTDMDYAFLKKCDSLMEPDRVMIEFNGMWSFQTFRNVELPFDWLLVQIISTVDASTFEVYINNMRSLIYEQLRYSETIILNRCDAQTKKLYLRNNIKAMNKGAQMIFETKEGKIVKLDDDELPFDVHADRINIDDVDYGLWYMDALEHPQKYEQKTVCIRGKVISNKVGDEPNAFVLGRYAMVCCGDDTALIGLLCHYKHVDELILQEWVEVTAFINVEYDEIYHGELPVLYVKSMNHIAPIEDELVYFT